MIIINDEKALRMKCDDVAPNEVGALCDLLENELNKANRLGKNGIGLAAPQIGVAKNIAIVRLPKLSLNLINCKIAHGYDPAIFKDEGCLSFPGRVENTIRFQEVHITNNLIEPYSFVATGMLAVVCQHEIDHLNSSLFFDHLSPKLLPIVNSKKIGPNEQCFCGSNKKYKKCCGRNV